MVRIDDDDEGHGRVEVYRYKQASDPWKSTSARPRAGLLRLVFPLVSRATFLVYPDGFSLESRLRHPRDLDIFTTRRLEYLDLPRPTRLYVSLCTVSCNSSRAATFHSNSNPKKGDDGVFTEDKDETEIDRTEERLKIFRQTGRGGRGGNSNSCCPSLNFFSDSLRISLDNS